MPKEKNIDKNALPAQDAEMLTKAELLAEIARLGAQLAGASGSSMRVPSGTAGDCAMAALKGLLGEALEGDDFTAKARGIFDASCRMTGAVSGYVVLVNEESSEMQVLFLEPGGARCTVDRDLPMPLRGLRAEAFNANAAVYENEFSSSRWAQLMPAGHVELENVMFAPISYGGRVYGLMGLANKPGGFCDADAEAATLMGRMCALVLRDHHSRIAATENRNQYIALADVAADAIVTIDTSGAITFANAAFERMFGTGDRGAIGQPLENFMPEAYRLRHREGMARTVDAGALTRNMSSVEVVAVDAAGREFPVEVSVSMGRQGDAPFYTGIIRDITERKRAEEQLISSKAELEASVAERTLELFDLNLALEAEIEDRKAFERALGDSESRYRGFLENFGGIAFREAADGTPEFFHGSVEEITGYSERALMSQQPSWRQIIHHDDVQKLRGAQARLCACPGNRDEWEYRIIRADGEVRWVREVLSCCSRGDSEGAVYFQGAIYDITEHVKNAQAIAESESRYRTLFEHSPMALMEEDFSGVRRYFDELSARGVENIREYFKRNPGELMRCASMIKVVELNRAAFDMYGCRDMEDFTRGLSEIFTPLSLDTFTEELAALARGETVFEGETVNRTLSGRPIVIRLCLFVVPGHEADLSRVIVSIVDITEQKGAEERLREAAARAERERARTQGIIAALGSGLCMMDTGFRLTYQNDVHRQYYGDTIGQVCYSAYYGRDSVCDGCPVEAALRTGGIHTSERKSHTMKGTRYFENTASPLMDEGGRIIGAVQVAHDITARREMLHRVERSHDLLRNVLDGLDAVVYVADVETYQVLFLNLEARETFGDGIGLKCYDVFQNGQAEPCSFCTNGEIMRQIEEGGEGIM